MGSQNRSKQKIKRAVEVTGDAGYMTLHQHCTLSEREMAIIDMVSRGFADNDICEALGVHPGTIKNHIHRLLLRWGLKNRTQLAIAAYQFGMVDPYKINLWEEEGC
jgi:DNA-binding NarL/FixJ family response regulator